MVICYRFGSLEENLIYRFWIYRDSPSRGCHLCPCKLSKLRCQLSNNDSYNWWTLYSQTLALLQSLLYSRSYPLLRPWFWPLQNCHPHRSCGNSWAPSPLPSALNPCLPSNTAKFDSSVSVLQSGADWSSACWGLWIDPTARRECTSQDPRIRSWGSVWCS